MVFAPWKIKLKIDVSFLNVDWCTVFLFFCMLLKQIMMCSHLRNTFSNKNCENVRFSRCGKLNEKFGIDFYNQDDYFPFWYVFKTNFCKF